MSVIHQSRIGRLRAAYETSFGTDGTGTIGNYFAIPFIIDTIEAILDEPVEQPGHVIQRLDWRALGVLMPRLATRLKFATNLETYDTKLGSGGTPTRHWLGYLFEAAFGKDSSRVSTGTTISGGTSTTSVLAVASAASHRAGMAVAMVNPTTGLLEMREIESVDTGATPDTITLKMALSWTPANAEVVYPCYTYFLHNNPNGDEPNYLQFLVEGYAPYDRWMLPGGALESLAFESLDPGGIPRATWSWQHPSWFSADGSDTVVDLVGETLGRSTYTDIALSTVRDADLRIRVLGSSAIPFFLHATKVQLTPNIRYEALRSPGGVLSSTCRGYRRLEVFPDPAMGVDIEVPMEDNLLYDTWQTDRSALSLSYQIGTSSAEGGILLSVPTVQITQKPGLIAIGGVRGRSVRLEARQDEEAVAAGGATEDETACAEACFRIHFR